MSNSPNFNLSLSVAAGIYNTIRLRINGPADPAFDNAYLTYLVRDDATRENTLVIRSDRRPYRQPVPYPVHAHVLSSQQRDAERRRAAMTPSTSGTYVPQAREVRLPSICAPRPSDFPRPNPDDLTQLKDVESDDLSKDCPICLSKYNIGEKVRILLCNHKFHQKCIDQWFNTLLNCPICRTGIDGNPHEDEERPMISFIFDSEDNSDESGVPDGVSSESSSAEEQEIIVID